MASVINQLKSLDFRNRYRMVFLPATSSNDAHEPIPARVARHLRQINKLRRAISHYQPAIVHIHTCSGFSFYRALIDLIVARIMRRRTILHVHGGAFDSFHAEAPPLMRRVIQWGLATPDTVIALSVSWRSRFRAMYPTPRVTVVENAVAMPDQAHSATGFDQHEVPSRRCRFLLLARMDVEKGIDDLLTACALLRSGNSSLEVVLAGPPGTAGDARILLKKIHQLRLSGIVRYVGEIHGTEKDRFFRSAAAYVQPSHHEGMPIAVLEAMAYGLPVVATGVGALGEVISPGDTGLLVPPRQPSRLAQSMATLIGDPAMRRQMGAAARRRAEQRFSLNRLRKDLVNVYDALLSGSRCAEWDGTFSPSDDRFPIDHRWPQTLANSA